MQITEIRIKLMDDKESRNERLLAFCSVTFDHMFVVRDLKIIEGLKGLFVAMPSKKRKDGQFKDIAHPLNQETRTLIENKVFEAYENEIRSMGASLENIRKRPSGEY